MSNLRISDLTNAFPDSLQNGDLIPIARSGETRKLIGINLKSSILGTIPIDLTNLTTKVSNLLANDSSTINLTFLNSSYSLSANVISGSIDTVHLTNSGVTTDKIANLNVTPGKLSTGAPSWNSSGDATIQRALIVNRQDLNQEGGEIRLARAIDNSVAWHIDALGTSNTPDFRIFDGPTQTVRLFIEGDNGNVGIGTTSPLSRFTVTSDNPVGNGPFLTLQNTSNNSTDAYGPSIVFRTGRVGEMPIITGVRQNDSRFYIAQASSPFTEFFTVNSSGNVGINTTAPREIIDVNGTLHLRAGTAQYQSSVVDVDSRTQSYISFAPGSSNNDWAYLRQIGGDSQYHLALDFHDDSDDARFSIRSVQSTLTPDNIVTRFTINSTGNVGIGTASPTERLTVSGNINATGNISSSGTISATGNISTTNTVTASAFVANSGRFANNEVNDYLSIEPSDDSFRFFSNGAEVTRITSSGNMGIGTTSPAGRLHVAGGSFWLSNTIPVITLYETDATANNGIWDIIADGETLFIRTVNDAYNNAGNALYINRTGVTIDSVILPNGNVGIGAASPTARLTIESSGTTFTNPTNNNLATIRATNTTNNSTNAHAILSLNTTGAGGGNPFISLDVNGVSGWSAGIDNADADKFKIASNWSNVATDTRLTIDRTGNVGIGNISPGADLQIGNGTFSPELRLQGLRTGNWQANLLTFGDELNSRRYWMNTRGTNENTNASWRFYYYHPGTAGPGGATDNWRNAMSIEPTALNAATYNLGLKDNTVYINSNNNVGIGTSTPTYRLTIAGNNQVVGFDNTAVITAKNAAGNYENVFFPRWSDNVTYLNYGSGGLHIRNNADASVLFAQNGGNVGIGTADPTVKLDVRGEIRSTGHNIINNGAPTLYLQDTNNIPGMIRVASNQMLFLRGSNINSLNWAPLSNNQCPLLLDLANGDNYVGGNILIQNGIVSLRNTAGTFRFIQYMTANANRSVATARFDAGITNGAETGSNVGSDYFIHRFSDTGVFLGRPLFISRSTGNVSLENNLYINTSTNPLAITFNWTNYPAGATDRAEISNDTGTYKTLMIVGNRSNDADVRRVSVWDRLEVHGDLQVSKNLGLSEKIYLGTGFHISTRENITTRVDSGFYQASVATTGKGWPVTSNSWFNLISNTHGNENNYYSMQFAGSIFHSSDLFYRATDGDGNAPWHRVWNNSNSPASRVQNGYQRFASGIIIQWGATGAFAGDAQATVTFPIAFPNMCAALVPSVIVDVAGRDVWPMVVGTPTATQGVIARGYIGPGANNTNPCHWIAIGW